MKKFLIYFLLLTSLISCQNKSSNQTDNAQEEANLIQKVNDEKLLADAGNFFKPLPAVAESPDNPITLEKVALGKELYYDTHLSKTGNNSCNSCHNLATFGVDNKPTSTGDAGKNGQRNSPTVLNAAFHTTQFWDGRAQNVEEQAGMPILNPVEMAMPSKTTLEKKLKADKNYQVQFAKAFPETKDPVTYENLQKAIGAFERTLVTPSQFDEFLRGDIAALSHEEKNGLKTFMDVGCTTCHNGVTLGGNMFQKFGVTAHYSTFTNSKTEDIGRALITKQDADKDFFKVPGLRNISKTYPYFHDGSVSDLNKAVAIMAKAQLNKELTEQEINSIVVFLSALTGEVPADALKMTKEIALK